MRLLLASLAESRCSDFHSLAEFFFPTSLGAFSHANFPKMTAMIFCYSSVFLYFFERKEVFPSCLSNIILVPGSRSFWTALRCNTESPRSTRLPSILTNLFGRESFSTLDLQSCAKENSSGREWLEERIVYSVQVQKIESGQSQRFLVETKWSLGSSSEHPWHGVCAKFNLSRPIYRMPCLGPSVTISHSQTH